MRLFTTLAALLTVTLALAAQDQSGRRTPGSPPPPPRGIFHPIVDYVAPPLTLKELVKRADVIVDGTAQSVFPTRLRDAGDATSVETDTLLAVDRVLKGQPELLRSLVITRMGGIFADVEVVIDNQAALTPGDRHILFVNYDRRTIVPTYPRTDGNFSVVNGSFGDFRIEGTAIKWFGPDSMEAVRKVASGTAEDFIAQIRAEVAAAK